MRNVRPGSFFLSTFFPSGVFLAEPHFPEKCQRENENIFFLNIFFSSFFYLSTSGLELVVKADGGHDPQGGLGGVGAALHGRRVEERLGFRHLEFRVFSLLPDTIHKTE